MGEGDERERGRGDIKREDLELREERTLRRGTLAMTLTDHLPVYILTATHTL